MATRRDQVPDDTERARHRRAMELFKAALGCPAGERHALLRRECDGDPELRQTVEALLAHDAAAEDDVALDRVALQVAAAVHHESVEGEGRIATPLDLAAGTMLGPYEIQAILGEGGFGTVYAAEQRQPVRRRVAVKVLKAGLDTREVLARFEAERNALAMMDHRGIARVHDAGTTAGGLPYFVMELIAGVPITRFCDDEHLPLRARLRLFLALCQAVHHAHQKGVVHRDLKPSNVLVTNRDGEPVPVVIDFGIAKATTSLTDHTLLTRSGQLLGTPDYMSPEQAEGTSAGVDLTTDVYSLGVLLYELLTGQLPFAPQQLSKRGIADVQRVLREVDPARPSSRVPTTTKAKAATGTGRGDRVPTLRRDLAADLDWVVLKAMDKERTRRYGSAAELAVDIQRFLDHEPLRARPWGLGYRVAKFTRRNRALVAFGAILLVTLVGGIVATTLALARTRAALRHSEMLRLVATSANIGGDDPLAAMDLAVQAADLERSLESMAEVRQALARPVPAIRVALREHEWSYLRGAPGGDRLLSLVTVGEGSEVVFWDADGRELARHAIGAGRRPRASCFGFSATSEYAGGVGGDGTLLLWTRDGRPLVPPDRGSGFQTCVWAPDGRLVVATAGCGTVEIFDLHAGREVTLRDAAAPPVTSNLVVGNDGAELYFGTARTLERWSLAGSRVAVVDVGAAVSEVAVSPKGLEVVARLADGSLGFWDSRQAAKDLTVRDDLPAASHVHASPDGGRFLTYHRDGPARLWDSSGREVAALVRPDGLAFCLFSKLTDTPFSPRGERLVTAYEDHTVCVWDRDGRCVRSLSGFPGSTEMPVRWSRSGARLFVGQAGHTRVLDADGRLRMDLRTKQGVGSIVDLRDDEVWTGHSDSLQRWDLGAMPFFLAHHAVVYALAVHGTTLLTGSLDGWCRLWTLEGQLLREFGPVESAVSTIDFSADGRSFAAGHFDGSIRWWSTASEQLLDRAAPTPSAVRRVVFLDSAAPSLVSIDRDERVTIWDLISGEQGTSLLSDGATLPPVRSPHAVFAPTHSGPSRSLGVRALPKGGGPGQFLGIPGRWCNTAQGSPDHRVLAAGAGRGEGEVWLWRWDETHERWREPPAELAGHGNDVWRLSFSSDSRLLASCSHDATIRIWSVATGTCVGILRGHRGSVRDVAFLPGDREVISTGEDGYVRRWSLDGDQVLAQARRLPLSQDGSDRR